MLTGQEAVDTIVRRVHRATSASAGLEADILAELKNAQVRLESAPTLPQFLLSERAFIGLTLNEERAVLPMDFIREHEEDDMQIQDSLAATPASDFSPLKKGHLDTMRRLYKDGTPGRPKRYAQQGKYFRVRPIPDKASYLLWMTYYKKDDVITLIDQNGWLKHFPDLLVSDAGKIIAESVNNQKAVGYFERLYERMATTLVHQVVAQQEANRDPNPED